jgi:hypothetical protein
MDQTELSRIAQSLEKLEQLYSGQLRQNAEQMASFDEHQKEFKERQKKWDQKQETWELMKPRGMTTNERVLTILTICLVWMCGVQIFLILNLHK